MLRMIFRVFLFFLLRNTCANGIREQIDQMQLIFKRATILRILLITRAETQLILLHLYTSKKRYNISLDTLNEKCWFSSGNGTVNRECGSGTKGHRFWPRTLPLFFGQNPRTCASCERIEKNSEACNITFACAGVISPSELRKVSSRKYCRLRNSKLELLAKPFKNINIRFTSFWYLKNCQPSAWRNWTSNSSSFSRPEDYSIRWKFCLQAASVITTGISAVIHPLYPGGNVQSCSHSKHHFMS